MLRRLLLVSLHVLFATTVLATQDPQVLPSDPLHHFVELELGADGATIETTVDFDGMLFVWVSSQTCDPSLRVELALLEEPFIDEDSGGGMTAFLQLDVQPGDVFTFTATATSEPDAHAIAELHWVAALETELTRKTASAGRLENEAIRELRDEGQLDEARERATNLLERLMSVEGREMSWEVPQVLWSLSFTCRSLSILKETNDSSVAALAARERLLPQDHPALLDARQLLAATRLQLGDLAGAHELFEVIHAARERLLPVDHPERLAANQNLAITRKKLGDLPGAHELFEAIHAAQERLLPADDPKLLAAKSNLAVTRKELGDLAGALELEELVHAAHERLLPADHPVLLDAKQNLASTRRQLGDLRGALELGELVHAACERLLPADHPDLLAAKLSLAITRAQLGDLRGALELEELVHAARERLLPADHPDLLNAKHNLAVTRGELGDLTGALELEELVHAAQERLLPEGHPALLTAKQNLAATRRELGDLAGALELEELVHAARERLLPADHPALLAAKQNLGVTRYSLGDLAGALALRESLLQAQLLIANQLHREAPRVARAGAHRELDRLFGTLFLSAAVASATETEDLPNLEPLIFSVLESLRGVSVASSAVAEAAATHPELASLRNSIARVRRELSQTTSAAPEDPAAMDSWRAEIFALSEERDQLQGELREELAERGLEFQAITAQSVANKLSEDSAFVSFLRYTSHSDDGPRVDSLLAFVITPDARVQRVDLGSASELEELAAQWRAEIGAPVQRGLALEASGEQDESGKLLRELLVDPCLAVLGEKTPAKLHLILDDFLHLLPLEALPWKEEQCLGQAITLHIENSALRLVRPTKERDGAGVLLAFGDVNYDSEEVELDPNDVFSRSRAAVQTHFERLLQTHFEVETLGELYDLLLSKEPVLFTRDEATVEALVENAPNARYLHIATHGWFAPSKFKSTLDGKGNELVSLLRAEDTVRGFAPESLCGLALSGANRNRSEGIITAEELSTLDLSNCELAVLSACETNVGLRRAGQGIQSLQTALHAAGARTAITSLWNVDDAATRRLMEIFYTKLWSEDLGKADALWQAKMALRNEGHGPRDWAAWVLTGDPR